MASKKEGVYIHLSIEEKEQLDEVCDYMGISRSKFVNIVSDVVYNRILMGYTDISADEIASKYKVGYGIVMDLCNIE